MLQCIGHNDRAEQLACAVLKRNRLSASERSRCYYILGRISAEQGKLDLATHQLQQSIGLAVKGDDSERAAWSQARLLVIIADSSGPDAAASLLAELRATALRSGNARVLAAFHTYVAQIEAKRGLASNAWRHLRAANNLLNQAPNVWLRSMAQHIEATLFIMAAEYERALEHMEASVALASECGHAVARAVSLGNLAHVLFICGRFTAARETVDRALLGFVPGSDNYNSLLDLLARIELAESRLDPCGEIIERIEQGLTCDADKRRYAYRHSLITKAKLQRRRGDLAAALETLDTVARAAALTRDDWLSKLATIEKLSTLTELRCLDEVNRVIRDNTSSVELPLDLFALYQGVIGSYLGTLEWRLASAQHVDRGDRIYYALGHAVGKGEIRAIREKLEGTGTIAVVDVPLPPADLSVVIQSVAALFSCVSNPEILAREMLELLWPSGCLKSATVMAVEDTGTECVLFIRGPADSGSSAVGIRIGACGNRQILVTMQPADGAEVAVTFAAVVTIVRVLSELCDARAQRAERIALWPEDNGSLEAAGAVASGHAAELLSFARRIARTTVNVLITGESGTGKEILARAIHSFSDRSKKPFVPFNCAAVPRELIETQLFGHRRGAFTGADSDHLGVIRTAKDGTLFLDEIGEMSLDMQPKLLRFLESGEIAPLGEPAPLNVNVRIVAATNRNLDDLVQQGRFREDLFYRLNVVRLTIKPLRERRDEIPGLVTAFVARAAAEFNKGHLEVAEETMERLILYRWPGNVRQLQNEVRRMVALAEPGSTIGPDAIGDEIAAALPVPRPLPKHPEVSVSLHDKLQPTLARIETEMIKAAMRKHHGRVEEVAKALGISRKGLYLKRQRLGL